MSAEVIYRENYEALSQLPIVKKLLKENLKIKLYLHNKVIF